jgi:uncharacterized membrane protein YphA (DoxX/SURF4 family)
MKFFCSLLYGNMMTLLLRLLISILFILSGLSKALDPQSFSSMIIRYGIIDQELAPYIAIILPHLEMLVGLCLLLGFRIRPASLIGIGMMTVFIIAVGVNLYKGENFECGCFDTGRFGLSFDDRIGPLTIIRNLFLLGIFCVQFVAKKHLLSLEHVIERNGLKNIRL